MGDVRPCKHTAASYVWQYPSLAAASASQHSRPARVGGEPHAAPYLEVREVEALNPHSSTNCLAFSVMNTIPSWKGNGSGGSGGLPSR